MTTLTTTRMLLAMVAVKVVMMTVLILVVVTRRMTMATTKYGPRDRGHDVFRVGELHGRITPRSEEVADLLSCIDGSRPTSNIWGERWSKLTTNASSNPITAMTGLGSNGAAEIPEARRLQIESGLKLILIIRCIVAASND